MSKQYTAASTDIEVWHNPAYVNVSGVNAEVLSCGSNADMFMFNAMFMSCKARVRIDIGATNTFVNKQWLQSNNIATTGHACCHPPSTGSQS